MLATYGPLQALDGEVEMLPIEGSDPSTIVVLMKSISRPRHTECEC